MSYSVGRWHVAYYPRTTVTGMKMEINTKEPEAILCCSLTLYHFTLKACIHKGFTVTIKHARAHAKDTT